MKLYIVRHGQTEDNAARVFSGNRNGELSQQGHEEARRLGERLAEHHFDFAYVSSLKRAQVTMEYIRKPSQYVVSPLLQERHFGVYEGNPVETLFADLELANCPREQFCPDGGEAITDVESRLHTFWEETLQHCSGTGIIVAHGSLNRCLLKLLLGLSYTEQFAISQKNTCVNLVEGDTLGAFQPVFLNCIEHLQHTAT